eukprot:scaffold3412_cov19-Tisochrysis_lutea.AAC.2
MTEVVRRKRWWSERSVMAARVCVCVCVCVLGSKSAAWTSCGAHLQGSPAHGLCEAEQERGMGAEAWQQPGRSRRR